MSSVSYYIAAAWDNPNDVPSSLTAGDGRTTIVNGVTYVNVALNSGTSYALLVRVDIVSDNNQPLIQYSEKVIVVTPLSYSEGGLAFGILLIIAIIVAIVVGVIVGIWYR